MFAVVAAGLLAAAAAQSPPVIGGIRWSSSQLRATRDGFGAITSTKITSWSDTSSTHAAVQADTNLQPTVVENAIFCHSSVRFGASTLGAPTHVAMANDIDALEPSSPDGFTMFALTKHDEGAQTGLAVSKGTPLGPNFYGLLLTTNGGDTLMWVSPEGSATSAVVKQTFTDFNRWVVWSFRMNFTAGSTTLRDITAYRDGATGGWLNGGYSGAPSNTYTGIVNSTAGFRLGGNGFVYRGQLMDTMIYPRALTDAEMVATHAWYDSTYHLTCPMLNSTDAVNGQDGKTACSGSNARWWNECRQTCQPGFTMTYGATEHVCIGGEWTASPIVCEKTCPTLAAPSNIDMCRRTLIDMTPSKLSGRTISELDNKWFVYPRVPRSQRATYWNVNGGASRLETRITGVACAVGVPSFLVIDKPIWQSALAFTSHVTVNVEFTPLSGTVGVVLRWLDEANHIRVMYDLPASRLGIVLVSNGVATPLANTTFSPTGGYVLRIEVQGPSIRVCDDSLIGQGASILNATSSVLRQGTYGLGSAGQANFNSFKVTSDCDGGNACINAAPGTVCNYRCASGYRQVSGSNDYTCGSDGSWGSNSLLCSIDPPVINTTAKSIRENSLELALVGSPVDATSQARGATFRYAITQILGTTGAVGNKFAINDCSGQMTVAPGAVLDYEASDLFSDSVGRYYTVEVEVTPNGDASNKGRANINVYLLDVNEAAAFAAPIIPVSIMEDAAAGTAVSAVGPNFYPVTGTDPDTFNAAFRNNRYVLESDAFPAGMFLVDASTGAVTVNRTGALDFETQPELDLRIRVEDVVDNDLVNAYTLRVSVFNVNEPPIMASPQALEVDETAAVTGSVFSLPVGARDPDNDPLGYSLSGTTADNNNLDPDNVGSGPMFTINGATGFLSWAQTRTFLPNSPTRVVDGRLVRQVYNVYVVSSDGTLSTTAMVKVYLMVNLTASALPTQTGFTVQTAGATQLPSTLGNELMVITGTAFVKVPAYARVEVNMTEYDAAGSMVRPGYTARNCAIDNPSRTIRCRTPPGVGTNLRVEAFLFDASNNMVPALYTTPQIFNYEAPFYGKIVNATGYSGGWPSQDLYLLRTSYGGRFYIHGSGFGLDPSLITAVYGPATSTWPTTIIKEWWQATVVATNGTMITLDAQPGGFGTYMFLKLTVGGQTFIPNQYQLSFGYRAPIITGLFVERGATYGLNEMPTSQYSARIMFNATDLPPSYWYSPDGQYNYIETEGYYGNTILHPSGCSYEWPEGGCYKMEYCGVDTWSFGYPVGYCWLPDSFGGGFSLSLVIRDGDNTVSVYSDASHLTARPPNHIFGHRGPNITDVQGAGTRNADTAGGQTLSITGTYLGPLSLNAASYGVIGISARYGNRLSVPWNESNPSARYQYEAKNCKVVESTWSGVGRVECDTGEGAGVGHALRLNVGGQWSNELRNAVSYAAPIVAGFDGPGSFNARTSGLQEVIVYGKNFGNDISLLNASYWQVIDADKTGGLQANQFVNIISRNRNNNLFNFTPANCTYRVNHTALSCFTAPGAGGNLKWFVTVAGQLSRDPFAAYGPARVTNISLGAPQDSPSARSKEQLDPAGFEILYIHGENFGPTTPQMLQWVRFAGANQAPTFIPSGYILSVTHNLIQIITVPGYGQNLAFEFMVGDQESGRTSVTFSYRRAKLEYILPQNGTTKSIAPDQYRVRVFASYLPNDAAVRFYVNVGNPADSSRTQVICTRDSQVAGIIQSVSCPWPSGGAKKRQVVLFMDRPGVTASVVQADGFATFDYRSPNVYYTTADPASDPAWNASVATFTANRATRVIQVVGIDFGQRIGADSIRREVMLRNKTVGLRDDEGWVPIAQSTVRGQANVIFSWAHDSIVFFTDTTNAEARLKITGRDIEATFGGNTTAEIVSWSNIFDISITKPTIQSVEGIPIDGFNTAGGQVLTINMPWPTLAGGAAKFQVELGSPTIHGYCKVLNRQADGRLPTWGPANTAGDIDFEYADNTAGAFLSAACRDQFGSPTDSSVCKFYCRMPASRGGARVPVFINVDDVRSNGVPVYFRPPTITRITVVDSYNAPVSPAVLTTFNLLTTPNAVVSAPTSNATLIIEGTNFGYCPTVIVTTTDFIFHERSTCETSKDGNDYSVPDVDRTHIKLTVPVPPGQGSRYNDAPFVFTLRAGSDADLGQDNMQPTGSNITFAWQRPIVMDITPRDANTRGISAAGPAPGMAGSLMTITGRNFGAPLNSELQNDAVVTFDLPDSKPAVVCANVTRIDHFTLTCIIREGSGGNMNVTVTTLNLRGGSGENGALFSYTRPNITDVTVESWHSSLYESWPDMWMSNRTQYTPVDVVTTPEQGARGPTTGRYKVRVRGSNFGPLDKNMNCILVAFNYAAIDCNQPLFFGTALCKCQRLQKAGTASSDIDCAWSWSDRMRLTPDRPTYNCNGLEDSFGEGEVFNDAGVKVQALKDAGVTDYVVALQSSDAHGAGLVLEWSHDEVTFLMPPGMGMNILTVLARNQFPPMSNEVPFTYDAPEIHTVKALSGAIQTGPAANDIIEITGKNLGASWPRNQPDLLPIEDRVVFLPNGEPQRVAPNARGLPLETAAFLYAHHAARAVRPGVGRELANITEGTFMPAATVTVQQWLFCVSSAGSRIPLPICAPNKNTTWFTLMYHSHSRIMFRSHPGIGADRNLLVHVHNPFYIMSSGNASFSYDIPMPRDVDPIVLPLPRSRNIDIMGYNFGDAADEQYYTESEKMAYAIIDDVMWMAERSANSTVRNSPSMGRISLPVSDLAVGKKDLWVAVAGQRGPMYANTTDKPLHVVCSFEYFGRLGEVCLPCPGGAYCDGYISDLDTERNMTDPVEANRPYMYPVPKPQFYNLNTSDSRSTGMDAVCPDAVRALFPDRKDVCIVGCVPPEACAGENKCTEGYTSIAPYFRCGSCDKGYYRRSNECVKCPDSPWLLVIGFCMLAVGFCGVGFFLNKKNVNIAFLSIAVDYAQVVSMFASSRIAWPPEIKELLHILSAFNLNIEIIAPECIKPDISYVQKWGAIMLLPISASVVFMGVFVAGYLWKRCVKGQRGRAFLLSHQDALIAMFLILFYFMYLYITRTLLEVFNCVPTNPDDGQTYMAAVFEPCGKPGGTQLFLMPMAIAGLLLYTAGYPVFCAWLLKKYQFEIMLDQLLRAKGTGDTQMTNPHAHWMRVRFSRLYYQYKPDFYGWMILVLMRKFLIAWTALMFRKDGGFQMAVALLVLFAAYALQVKWEPFMSPSDRANVLRDHERSRFEGGVHTRLAEALKDAASKERKRTTKIDWAAPKAVLGKQILNKAGLFLFNYNTVESLLLGIAILICLAGIMFESLANRADNTLTGGSLRVIEVAKRECARNYKGYCTGLMWGVIMLISFSVVYLIVVVTVEINGAFQEAKLSRANTVKRAKMAKKLGLDGSGPTNKSSLTRAVAKVTKDVDDDVDPMADSNFAARIGVLETAVNPLFANAKGGDAAGKDGKELDTDNMISAASIADMDQPPNPALWAVMRDTYKTLIDQSIKQREQITALKRQQAEWENAREAEAQREEELAAAYGLPSPKQQREKELLAREREAAKSRLSASLDGALESGGSAVASPRAGIRATGASGRNLSAGAAGKGKKAFGPASAARD